MRYEVIAEITAPHFTAGIVLENDRVIEAAPIVKSLKGKTRAQVRDYCLQQGWKVVVVTTTVSK